MVTYLLYSPEVFSYFTVKPHTNQYHKETSPFLLTIDYQKRAHKSLRYAVIYIKLTLRCRDRRQTTAESFLLSILFDHL
jgi:hypothetical protein